jgi:SagB-type dehydrogenase family enzyme
MGGVQKLIRNSYTRILSSTESETRVELRSRISGRRFSADRDEFAAMLLTGDTRAMDQFAARGGADVAEEQLSGVNHWMDRGWGEAVETYLASRAAVFIEDSIALENRDQVRAQAVRAMLKELPLPRPPGVGPNAIRLPKPGMSTESPSLGEVLGRRRTTPYFSGKPVSLDAVASTLWHGLHALRANREVAPETRPLEALQSVGSAFDVWVLSYDMTGLDSGSYFYEPERHMLELQQRGDYRELFEELLIGQPSPKRASSSILLMLDFPRYQWRYRHERALRLLYFEAGRLMQYLLVAATAEGMRTHITPALKDSETLDFLGLSGRTHQAIYCLTLGG